MSSNFPQLSHKVASEGLFTGGDQGSYYIVRSAFDQPIHYNSPQSQGHYKLLWFTIISVSSQSILDACPLLPHLRLGTFVGRTTSDHVLMMARPPTFLTWLNLYQWLGLTPVLGTGRSSANPRKILLRSRPQWSRGDIGRQKCHPVRLCMRRSFFRYCCCYCKKGLHAISLHIWSW
jgi:hypothetical protein